MLSRERQNFSACFELDDFGTAEFLYAGGSLLDPTFALPMPAQKCERVEGCGRFGRVNTLNLQRARAETETQKQSDITPHTNLLQTVSSPSSNGRLSAPRTPGSCRNRSAQNAHVFDPARMAPERY